VEKLTDDSREELLFRLDCLNRSLDFLNPEKAVPESKAMSYSNHAASFYAKGIYLHLLDRQEHSNEVFIQVIPNLCIALSYCLDTTQESRTQNILLEHALLLGDVKQVSESANIVSKLGVTEAWNPLYYLMLSNLFLADFSQVRTLLPEFEKLENKRSHKYVKAGTTQSFGALCDGIKKNSSPA
jgi:hypothetical protein